MRQPAKYIFISPTGVIHRGENIRRFAAQQGLDQANMFHVWYGERKSHKGWKAGGLI